jgi:hypothetical protein
VNMLEPSLAVPAGSGRVICGGAGRPAVDADDIVPHQAN